MEMERLTIPELISLLEEARLLIEDVLSNELNQRHTIERSLFIQACIRFLDNYNDMKGHTPQP